MTNIEQNDWEEIIRIYFKENNMAMNQINSFNEFCRTGIQRVVDEIPPFSVGTRTFSFGQIYIGKPTITETNEIPVSLYPCQARKKGTTYNASLYLTIYQTETKKKKETRETFFNVHIGDIPIMVQSDYCVLANANEADLIKHNECIHDPGGYFIIMGNERVLINLEGLGIEKAYVFEDKKRDTFLAEIRSAGVALQLVYNKKSNIIEVICPIYFEKVKKI